MKTYNLKTDFGNYDINITTDTYKADNSLAIILTDAEDGMDFAVLTVYIEDDIGLPYFHADNEAFVDTNNCPWAEDFIVSNGLGEPTGRRARSGFCTYPLYKFNLKKLENNYEKVI